MARYYVAYLRALNAAGVRPDLIEPVYEPNLKKKFNPADYAEFTKDLEADLGAQPSSSTSGVYLAGPGTAARVRAGLRFVEAMEARGALSSLKAITVHAYYVRDHPVNAGIPPADDPAFRSLAATATGLGIPFIATEFGGTDLKTRKSDHGRESVNSAEEM